MNKDKKIIQACKEHLNKRWFDVSYETYIKINKKAAEIIKNGN